MLRQIRQHLSSSRPLERFLALVVGFSVLYALTAQRGVGWGDSAEFQSWVLDRSDWICGPHFSNAHPLYVAFCRLVASTPFQVTLVSSFFGALSVGGFFLCTRCLGFSVIFGLSHMLWWNSCLAEVQTMNLAFTAFETLLLLKFLADGRWRWFAALVLLNGIHLEVHNFALLAAPLYAAVFFSRARGWQLALSVPLAALWGLGACGWLWAFATRGAADVLVGDYGAKVAGFLPSNLVLTSFNFALAAMSFFAPVAVAWWSRREGKMPADRASGWVWALLAVNFLFFVRYFVPDQATFLLPTLFFACLLASRIELQPNRLAALIALQVLLPLMAWQTLVCLPMPDWKVRHEGRNDAAYFALPWKVGIAR